MWSMPVAVRTVVRPAYDRGNLKASANHVRSDAICNRIAAFAANLDVLARTPDRCKPCFSRSFVTTRRVRQTRSAASQLICTCTVQRRTCGSGRARPQSPVCKAKVAFARVSSHSSVHVRPSVSSDVTDEVLPANGFGHSPKGSCSAGKPVLPWIQTATGQARSTQTSCSAVQTHPGERGDQEAASMRRDSSCASATGSGSVQARSRHDTVE